MSPISREFQNGHDLDALCSLGRPFQMCRIGSDVTERERQAEGASCAPIGVACRTRDAITRAVQARDRLIVNIEEACAGVDHRTTVRVQSARCQDNSVVGTLSTKRMHSHVGAFARPFTIGAHRRKKEVPLAVIIRFSAIEIPVYTGACERVETRNSGPQILSERGIQRESPRLVRDRRQSYLHSCGKVVQGAGLQHVRRAGCGLLR